MIKNSDPIFQRFYSDPKYQKTNKFFSSIRTRLDPSSRVLNLGAGPATNNPATVQKGEVAEMVGADIDPDVLTNTELDRAVVLTGDDLPFPDAYFDVVFSDYVVEHVEKPQQFLSEVLRVLKPGGSYFLRTPNNYHYVAAISRFTPHWFHDLAANRVRGMAEESHAPYPTFYRLNTRRALDRAARTAGFREVEIEMVEGHPSYLVFHVVPFLVGVSYERLVNSTELLAGMRANIYARLTK